MRIVKVFLTALTGILCMTSCIKIDPGRIVEEVHFEYLGRTAQFVWADNIRGEEKAAPTPNTTYIDMTPLLNDAPVKLSEYVLGFSTCNVGISDVQSILPYYADNFNSSNYNPLVLAPFMAIQQWENNLADAKDPVIESKLDECFNTKDEGRSTPLSRAYIDYLDYRVTQLLNLKVSCNKDMFGVKAGESLNSYFVVESYPQERHFIITSNKDVITDNIRNISLAKYLAYKPMVPAGMYMMLKKGVTIPAAETVEFTVELTLEGDSTISATTKPVTLLP